MYVYYIDPQLLLWALDHSHDRTSPYYYHPKNFSALPPESGVDERVHTYSFTYGQSIICFYMIGLGANFTMWEVAPSANSCAVLTQSLYLSGHIQYLRHTVPIRNRFPWLYINCFQSPWFQYIIIESGISPWWVVSRQGGVGFGGGGLHVSKERGYQEGGMKKERGG